MEYEDFWVSPDFIMFIGIEKPKESYKLVVKMSAGLGNGISSGWSKTVIVKISLEEINRKWVETDMSEGLPMVRSTFNRHKEAIQDMFGIDRLRIDVITSH